MQTIAAFVIHIRSIVDQVSLRLRSKNEFNAFQTQCRLLIHQRMTDVLAESVVMGGTNITEMEALGLLGMKIQYDVRSNEHIF